MSTEIEKQSAGSRNALLQPSSDDASRRVFLRKLAAASAGAAALTMLVKKPAGADPSLQALSQAMWIHGASVEVEFPTPATSILRRGFHTEIEGTPNGFGWFHFAIPTPVIVSDRRLRLNSVLLRYGTGDQARVTNVHVHDGERLIARYDGLRSPTNDHPIDRYPIPGEPEILWGVCISLGVGFGVDPGRSIRLIAVGGDFV